jgi:hypothetical protein
MPDGFINFNTDKPWVKRDYRTNVFATWKEIDAVLRDYYVNSSPDENSALNTGKTYFSDWVIGADQINKKNFKFQPFSNAILIDCQNEKGKQISLENNQLYKNVAQLMRFITVEEFGGTFKSDFNNTIRRHATESLKLNQKWVKQYTSAGYSEIRGGSFLFDEYVQFQLKKSLIKGLIGAEEKETIVLENAVNKILGRYLFNRIEADGFNNGVYNNKADSAIPNPHQILANSLKKIYSNYDDLSFCEKKEEVIVAAENIQVQFKTICDFLATNFKDDFRRAGFDEKKSTKSFFTDLYKELSDLIIVNGIRHSQQILDSVDQEIDKWFVKYESEFKQLDIKNITGYEEIKNKDLLAQIDFSYNKIKNGEGAPSLIGKNEWYIKQLTEYTDKIKAYVRYKADEVLLETKRNICFGISEGPHGDIACRKRVREITNLLGSEVDIDLRKEEQHLIEKFKSYSDDPLTRVVPDVSKYVDDFKNSQVNLFRELYETSCGLSFSKVVNIKELNRSRHNESSADLKTIEDLLKLVLNDTSILIAFLEGSLSAEAFVESLKKMLIARLETQSLKAILPSYGEISNRKLTEWVEQYPKDFERYTSDFMDRASLFCALNSSNVFEKKLWVTSVENQHLCEKIFNHNRASDVKFDSKVGIINEDVVALIKMAENISFDDYTNYPNYFNHYADSIKNPSTMFPHLDVRFKHEMLKYPTSADDNSILSELFKSKSLVTGPTVGNTDKFKIAFKAYSKLVFLSCFYEIIKSTSIRLSYFVDPSQDEYGDVLDVPIHKDEKEISFYQVESTSWGTVKINTDKLSFPLYTKTALLSDFRKSVYPPQTHNDLWTNIEGYQNCIDAQINVIKIVKSKEKSLSASIKTQIEAAISSYVKHMRDIIPDEEKKDLTPIWSEVKAELEMW